MWKSNFTARSNVRVASTPSMRRLLDGVAWFLAARQSHPPDSLVDFHTGRRWVWATWPADLLGGFSGSYIFSQTILNVRSKVANRWSGAVVCLMEVLLVLFPAPPTAFIPTGAFGGLRLLVGASLLGEWLIEARHRFSAPEYLVLLFTFASIHIIGLEAGFAAGLAFSALAFACQYARVHDETGGVACRRSKKAGSVRRRSSRKEKLCTTTASLS